MWEDKMQKANKENLTTVGFFVSLMALMTLMMKMMLKLMIADESKEARRVWLLGRRHKHPVALYQLQQVYVPLFLFPLLQVLATPTCKEHNW